MALSPEDRIEVQLLVLKEVGQILNESSGFSEARRAIDKRRQELEATARESDGEPNGA